MNEKVIKQFTKWHNHVLVCASCVQFAQAKGDMLREAIPCVVGKLILIELLANMKEHVSGPQKDWHI